MLGYEPRMLETRNVKLKQYTIYDEDDELIHSTIYDAKFSDGQVVEMHQQNIISMES
jgi:hypothetical protein